ncbi:MAG TPA: hypothetical protein PK970_08970, partial [Hyphomicrobiaceae bacterium]|nr:hypothetical protein [Hyphomicrobiaceae bacterium]
MLLVMPVPGWNIVNWSGCPSRAADVSGNSVVVVCRSGEGRIFIHVRLVTRAGVSHRIAFATAASTPPATPTTAALPSVALLGRALTVLGAARQVVAIPVRIIGLIIIGRTIVNPAYGALVLVESLDVVVVRASLDVVGIVTGAPNGLARSSVAIPVP